MRSSPISNTWRWLFVQPSAACSNSWSFASVTDAGTSSLRQMGGWISSSVTVNRQVRRS